MGTGHLFVLGYRKLPCTTSYGYQNKVVQSYHCSRDHYWQKPSLKRSANFLASSTLPRDIQNPTSATSMYNNTAELNEKKPTWRSSVDGGPSFGGVCSKPFLE